MKQHKQQKRTGKIREWYAETFRYKQDCNLFHLLDTNQLVMIQDMYTKESFSHIFDSFKSFNKKAEVKVNGATKIRSKP